MAKARLVAVVVILTLLVGYFLGLWSAIAGWFNGLWYFLTESTPVPNWLLGLFAICAIIVAGWLGASLRPRRRSPISTQDNFFNIRWRWSYDASGRVEDLTPYCLRCGHRLILRDVGNNLPVGAYECRCDRCGTIACEIDCSIEEFESRVLQKIHASGS